MEMLGPGTDTNFATQAHILWALAHDFSYQGAPMHSLTETRCPAKKISLESILRPRAAVKEGTRWIGAAAATLPKIVPEDSVVFGSSFLPGGICFLPRPTPQICL
jgi:hypothetical protein